MMECIGFTSITLGILSGALALKNFNSVFKPRTEKRSNPFVFKFYKNTSLSLLIVGTILLAIHYVDVHSWSEETRLKVTFYALVVATIASIYTMVQKYLNNRRMRNIEMRIKNQSDHV